MMGIKRYGLSHLQWKRIAPLQPGKASDPDRAGGDHAEAIGARPIIPQRACMNRSRDFDPEIYKERNRIERTTGHFKQLRRIAMRYDRLPENYFTTLSRITPLLVLNVDSD